MNVPGLAFEESEAYLQHLDDFDFGATKNIFEQELSNLAMERGVEGPTDDALMSPIDHHNQFLQEDEEMEPNLNQF